MSIARCFSKEKSLRILYISYIVSCVIVCMFYKGENATLSLFFVHVPVCVQQRERERERILSSQQADNDLFSFLFVLSVFSKFHTYHCLRSFRESFFSNDRPLHSLVCTQLQKTGERKEADDNIDDCHSRFNT